MVYATITEVQGLIPRLVLSTTSVPTTAQVTQFITDTASEIDSAIGSVGVAVPITSPAWFLADLKRLNAIGAAAQAWLAAFPQTSGPMAVTLGATLMQTYQRRLTEFRSNKGIPTMVSDAENDRAPRSFFTDDNATLSNGDAISAVPAFTREKQF